MILGNIEGVIILTLMLQRNIFELMKRLIVVILVLAAVAGGYFFWKKWRLTQPPPSGAVDMAYPLKDGEYEIIQSGRFFKIHTAENEKFAMDIVKHAQFNSWFQYRKSGLESDSSYGVPVYSPCRGIVKKVTSNYKDMPIGIVGSAFEANSMLIGCDGFNVSLIHFKERSAKVQEGDLVDVGQIIAEIGNSGKSYGPHLHIAAYTVNPQTNQPTNIPITFNGRYFYRGESFTN